MKLRILDYVALKELQDKPLWREKFGLTTEMVDFAVVPIIEIEGDIHHDNKYFSSPQGMVTCRLLSCRKNLI